MSMRIDAHHHIWRLERGDYDWLTTDLPIHRDYAVSDLRPLLGDITATILVQAAETEAETRFLLETARASEGLIRAVVGWTDLAAARAPAAIAELAADPLLRGLRPMLQDMDDPAWILRDDVQPGLAAMATHGLRLDLLVKPRHLPYLPELAARHPGLPMVIDHAAKPDIAHAGFQPWAEQMATLAANTSWCCKLSGLVTEAAPGWTADDLRPYIDHLLASFGPDRLMWGSDWPVLDLNADYAQWHAAANALLAPLSDAERAAVFGGNAAAFYRL